MTRNFRCALFDLDNTLYPKSSGVMQEIGNRINLFMVERLDMRQDEVDEIRDKLRKEFGTTLNALRRYYSIDPDDFLDFVHDLPLEQLLQPEPQLDGMLERLSVTKVIFTNADAKHARRVLSRLGVMRHFESIIDIHLLDFVNKPYRRAYIKALDFISAKPEECILLEDSRANILPAVELGITTVQVGASFRKDGAHYHIDRITDFEDLLRNLE